MPAPAAVPDCPPGLEYLTLVDQLLVKQKVELLEAFTGFETNNKYTIKNALGQNVIEFFFFYFYFFISSLDPLKSGLLGRWRQWLLYTKLLWFSSAIWNESDEYL